MAMTRLGLLAMVGVATISCASPPNEDACGAIVNVGCDGGTLEGSGAWTTGPWAGPHFAYNGLTTYRICHGLGRPPVSVEGYMSFTANGIAAQQIGNVVSVLPACGMEVGVTNNTILIRNGAAQDFFARFVFR